MLTLALAVALAMPPDKPTCIAPDGTRIGLELALTEKEQATGLMFRDALPEREGMLFLFKDDQVRPFWMKNTIIPLDMIWLDAQGRVVAMHERVQPCKYDPCPSYDPKKAARVVLEVNAGFAAAHKIKVGEKLLFQGVAGFPIAETKR